MTISTYTDLRASIKSWLRRSDLDSLIPDFIALCEADLNSRLRLSIMETSAQITVDSEYESFPTTDYLEARKFQLDTNPVQTLSYMSPQDMDRVYGGVSGKPLFYCTSRNFLRFAPPPDGTYTAQIDYYVKLDLADDASNAVLTKHPDLYLYGSLLQSAPYVHNDKRIAVWNGLYEKGIERAQREDRMKIYSGGVLEMRPG